MMGKIRIISMEEIMKFKVGDKIKVVIPFLRMNSKHVGAIGTVLEHRTWCARVVGKKPTHYVVKFDCYKIPHEYMKHEIEHSCDLIREKER